MVSISTLLPPAIDAPWSPSPHVQCHSPCQLLDSERFDTWCHLPPPARRSTSCFSSSPASCRVASPTSLPACWRRLLLSFRRSRRFACLFAASFSSRPSQSPYALRFSCSRAVTRSRCSGFRSCCRLPPPAPLACHVRCRRAPPRLTGRSPRCTSVFALVQSRASLFCRSLAVLRALGPVHLGNGAVAPWVRRYHSVPVSMPSITGARRSTRQ